MAVTAIILAGGQVLRPDVSTSITPTGVAEATKHPVDNDAPISDHVIVEPRTLSLTTFWTPRPDSPSAEPSGPDRPQQAFAMLLDALARREVIGVRCDGISYYPAVLTRVTQTRTAADGDSRTIAIDIQEIRIATSQTVAVNLAPTLRRNGRRKKAVVNPAAVPSVSALADAAEAAAMDWTNTLGIAVALVSP